MGMTIDQELAEISDLALKIQGNYLAILKAEKIAMLEELQLEIEELEPPLCHNASRAKGCADKWRVEGLIQQKINSLKGANNE